MSFSGKYIPTFPRIVKSNCNTPQIIFPDVPSNKSPINWSEHRNPTTYSLISIGNLPAQIVELSNEKSERSAVVRMVEVDVGEISVFIVVYHWEKNKKNACVIKRRKQK